MFLLDSEPALGMSVVVQPVAASVRADTYGYLTVSNSFESETPNARASRNRFLKEGFRRAVSIPPRYVRCI